MNSKELKKLLVTQWPSLKKPFLGEDPIICRDAEYPDVGIKFYDEIDSLVWEYIKSKGITYNTSFPDCDDFADIKLGKFKEIWNEYIKEGKIPYGTAPKYAVCDGYWKNLMHDFNIYTDSGIIVLSDYGEHKPLEDYKPIKARF